MVARATTVEEVMTTDPSTLSPTATVGEAHEIMTTNGFRHLPVVAEGVLVGILTMTDIGHLGAKIPEIRARTVGDVMTRNPITIAPSERVEVAAGQMAVRKVHCHHDVRSPGRSRPESARAGLALGARS